MPLVLSNPGENNEKYRFSDGAARIGEDHTDDVVAVRERHFGNRAHREAADGRGGEDAVPVHRDAGNLMRRFIDGVPCP